jgi:hypothetical protein
MSPARVVEFYQQGSPRRASVQWAMPVAEVPAPEVAGGGALHLSEVSSLVAESLRDANLSAEQAAGLMGISASLFGRQLQNLDNQHVSLQRLYRLPDTFWRPFLKRLAMRRKLARVSERLVFEFE